MREQPSATRDLSEVIEAERAGILAARKWAARLKMPDADADPDNAQPFDQGWNAALDALIRDLSPTFIVQRGEGGA